MNVTELIAMGATAAYGQVGGVWYHAASCGGAVHVAWDVPRLPCRCPDPDAPDSVCAGCGGSLWDCCGRADSEPHRTTCHTRVRDVGVLVCAGDRWAGSGLPKGWYGRTHGTTP